MDEVVAGEGEPLIGVDEAEEIIEDNWGTAVAKVMDEADRYVLDTISDEEIEDVTTSNGEVEEDVESEMGVLEPVGRLLMGAELAERRGVVERTTGDNMGVAPVVGVKVRATQRMLLQLMDTEYDDEVNGERGFAFDVETTEGPS